jgi:endo-1,4-beta-xylanase
MILLCTVTGVGHANFLRDSTLKKALSFKLGAAIKVNLLKSSPAYRKLIIQEFNSITAENAMKFSSLHPQENTFRWGDADYIVNFANQNNIRVHGHTLLWPSNNPAWIKNYKGDKAAWEQLLKNHIQTIVKHFRGKVTSWDVVNEAFEANGSYKKNKWFQNLGKSYIEKSFQYAQEADPKALLFYNDYGQEYSVAKREAILNMAKEFRTKGIKIDGFGLQMHTALSILDQKLINVIKVMARSGLQIHISELEVSLNSIPKSKVLENSIAKRQANKYLVVFKAFSEIPRSQQYGITTWNVSDKDAFSNGTNSTRSPLLFDQNYHPKAAYKTLLNNL